MEVRAKEEIPIGQDLTPPIPPLSLSLHHSTLLSHCSSCFSPLPSSPFSPTNNPSPNHFIRYCSLQCSSLDSPLHFSSSEFHFFHLFPQPLYTTSPTSTDLRLSLRLIHRFQEANVSFSSLERIGGLVTNFKKLTLLEEQQYYNDDDEGEISGRILEGAKATAVARRMRDGLDTNVELSAAEYAVEAAVLCLVLTNSVEVHDKDGRSLGVGVYDLAFSYINHSCSPNASYRFCTAFDCGGELEFRICPAASGTDAAGTEGKSIINGSEACGPRIVLRSIKAIQKSEEVLITYTDLLQPKVMRQSELWSKYRFSCCCKRCKAMPTSYIDHCLQEILFLNLGCSSMASGDHFYGDRVMERLADCLDDAINDFLSFSNPKCCCEKLEILLTQDHVDVVLTPNGENLHRLFRLHPLHHVSLQAYMTLASAYKVSESDLLALDSECDKHQNDAFRMSRKSAAYSLLLAGATHHLFESESSLVVPLSNFWMTAGETLLSLVKSSIWNSFPKGRHIEEISFSSCQSCGKCTLLDRIRVTFTNSRDRNAEFAEVTSQFLNCVTDITPKIWGFIIEEGGGYLKEVVDPINLRWLESRTSSVTHFGTHATSGNAKETDSGFKAVQHHRETRVNLFQLSIHCLLYGAFLSTICFGPHSPLTFKVENLLSHEG
ncbi:PREDICTED: protein SET DOMAIN GROUP 41 isoform X1 [Nicotiana attenuata]|uniref:protein SET DOMAIN GROUP 41 isoform X1 n=1 Tax=Nicotiana attenuata TaxID=49451 RepID=UPI000904780C|nr:PREDICTED: protein SET DOMAIN GROUP 41 isoform X1 [Nicotiana attenuata]